MKLTLYSNFFNHHQKPVCDEIFRALCENFTFVSTISMPQSFKDAGYPDYSEISYNLLSFKNNTNREKASELMFKSDVVIFGDAPFELVEPRLKLNKLTLFTSERIFKKGYYQHFDYRILRELYQRHTKYRKKNTYMLCAGAYAANDFNWVSAYPNKMFKWGYFPNVPQIDMTKLLQSKKDKKFKIIMVCRLISWKQPQLAIEMAKKLKELNLDFKLDIIGSGELKNELCEITNRNHLSKYVSLLGNLPNIQVTEKMKQANVLIFTSDRNEGWGAVVNEAMANGCTVVGSNEIGSLPYLIKPETSGNIFISKNANDLTKKILKLYYNREYCERLALNAYVHISEVWSPENAAKQLLIKAKELLNDKKQSSITNGPCSKAYPTNFKWFKKAQITVPIGNEQ